MIAAASFDDIFAITFFGIAKTLAFNEAGTQSESAFNAVFLNVVQIATGFAMAIFIALLLRFFNTAICTKIMGEEIGVWIKMVILLGLSLFFPWFSIVTEFHECKYIGIIFTGYFCNKWWITKPDDHLAKFWIICQPFLFGVVGASIRFNEIGVDMIGKGLFIIFVGIIFRWIAVVLVTFEKKYVFKERIFMAFAWLPKATV